MGVCKHLDHNLSIVRLPIYLLSHLLISKVLEQGQCQGVDGKPTTYVVSPCANYSTFPPTPS